MIFRNADKQALRIIFFDVNSTNKCNGIVGLR